VRIVAGNAGAHGKWTMNELTLEVFFGMAGYAQFVCRSGQFCWSPARRNVVARTAVLLLHRGVQDLEIQEWLVAINTGSAGQGRMRVFGLLS